MAVCYAAGGSVQCFCQPGFRGSGVGPMGCVPGTGGGSDVGPILPPRDGGGVVMSPCASGPCQNGATCVPMATSFLCNCQPGYTGKFGVSAIDVII